jgi:hypothetical protein
MSEQVEATPVAEVMKSQAVPSVKPADPNPGELVANQSQDESADDDHDEAEEQDESATSAGEDAPAHAKKNKGVGKRINELTREKYEERRAREAAESELAELRAKLANQGRNTDNGAPQPTLDQFDYDYEKFNDALSDWKAEQKLAQRSRDEQQRQQQEAAKAKQAAAQKMIAEYQEHDPDGWQEAISAPINYTPAMLDALGDSDRAPEIAVYLARNLDEADKISRMPPAAAIRALVRIESGLEDKPAPKPRVEIPRKLTNTPPPPKTLTSGSGSPKINLDDPNISPEARIAAWRANRQSSR